MQTGAKLLRLGAGGRMVVADAAAEKDARSMTRGSDRELRTHSPLVGETLLVAIAGVVNK